MKLSDMAFQRVVHLVTALTVVFLTACGGGGGASDSADSGGTGGTSGNGAAPPAPNVSGVVIDGYLYRAHVFLDLNGNGRFDSGEPESLTDSQGRFTLNASASQAASHAIVSSGMPGLTSDQDDPGVALPGPLWLSAPPGHFGVVSPLTTLVVARMAAGATVDSAKAAIQQSLGVGSVDVMKDFVAEKRTDSGYGQTHKLAGAIAEVLIEIERGSTASTTVLNKLSALEAGVEQWVLPNLVGIKTASTVAAAREVVIAEMQKSRPMFSVGGALSGLRGDGLVLANGTDTVSPDRDASTFIFQNLQAAGSSYGVIVQANPAGQNCQVINGAGTVSDQNVTGIVVTCMDTPGILSGVIAGLSTSGLVLQNAGEELTIPAGATMFSFPAPIPAGSSYSVFVKVQPIGRTCSVADGAGSMPSTGASNVRVTCSPNAYQVGGTIANLLDAGLRLRNGSDVLAVQAGSTTFAMPLPVAYGGSYSIKIEAQPNGQVCSVANSSGTMGAANVTSVQIACASNAYTLGGTVSDLNTDGLVLRNGSELLPVVPGSTSFVFGNPVAFGGTYAVTIESQPNRHTCTLANANGTMPGKNVASVEVTCSAYKYRLIDLGTLPGCAYSRATALSSDGKVAGNSCTQDAQGTWRSRAFLYANGKMQGLGVIGTNPTSESSATGVNSAAVVIGDSTGDSEGFIFRNGMMERFPVGVPPNAFPGLTVVTKVYPAAINDEGVVVGTVGGLEAESEWPPLDRAFVYQSGALRYLGNAVGGMTMFYAHSVNQHGQVVARGDFISPSPSPYFPYVTLFDLGSNAQGAILAGIMPACAPRVSNAGAVLMCVGKGPPIESWIMSGATQTVIPPLDPDAYVTTGHGINRWGEVVGYAYRFDLGIPAGFIYRAGKTLPLDDVLDASVDGWHIVDAADINDDGLIAATAKFKAGQERAVLLVPIR